MLKKESVRGVAASRNASACWTKNTVFTWGTNTGQLGKASIDQISLLLILGPGYDKVAHSVQVLPRPVTKIMNMVIDIALSVRVACEACLRH